MGSKFKVGDRVRLTYSPVEDFAVGTEYTVIGVSEHEGRGLIDIDGDTTSWADKFFELVEPAKSYTIEHIIPLIRDARQLDNAAHVVCDRGGDTTLMDKMLDSLYREIGEKVSRAVEVDA